jgi:hypothetical protein
VTRITGSSWFVERAILGKPDTSPERGASPSQSLSQQAETVAGIAEGRQRSGRLESMLFLLMVVTVGYFAGLYALRRKRTSSATPAAAVTPPALPAEDQPPAAAVGWPPGGARLPAYLDEGFAALDAYLSEDHPA